MEKVVEMLVAQHWREYLHFRVKSVLLMWFRRVVLPYLLNKSLKCDASILKNYLRTVLSSY